MSIKEAIQEQPPNINHTLLILTGITILIDWCKKHSNKMFVKLQIKFPKNQEFLDIVNSSPLLLKKKN